MTGAGGFVGEGKGSRETFQVFKTWKVFEKN